MGQHQVKKTKNHELSKKPSKRSLKNKEEITIVLLGPGEVGKSTIFKQIQLLFDIKFMDEYDFRIVNENSLMYFRECILVLEGENPKWAENQSEFHKKNIDIVRDLTNLQIIVEYENLPIQDIKETIAFLYKSDYHLRSILKQNHKYSLGDSINHIFSNIDNYFDDDYYYTEKDLLKSYKKTSGVSNFHFTYRDQKFAIYDTGGQRNERMKWKLILGKADAIIFVGALSQYNERCYEDDTTNKIIECLNLLRSTVKDEKVAELPFYLYLNKRDVLAEQLQLEDISVAFPDCPKELKFTENELLKFNSPLRSSMTKENKIKNESWPGVKKVGKRSRISDLSQDELSVIFSFLRAKEVCHLSLVDLQFYRASNLDGLWKQFCLSYDPTLKPSKINEFYDTSSNYQPWKYYYIKSKEFFINSEDYLVEQFIDCIPKNHARQVYKTSAIDNSIRAIFLKTLNDILELKHDQEKLFFIQQDFDSK